jgi:hypothetical protein
MTSPAGVISETGGIVSVVVILLMFLAVIVMVKRVDEDLGPGAILASDSRAAEDRIRLQLGK